MMLFRALDFAQREGELNRDYFLMTDSEAFMHLGTKCNKRTKTLMERADRWVFYPRVFNFRSAEISKYLTNFILNSDNRGKLADEISGKLKIPQEDVCVYTGKDKGFKKIHLPIVGDGDIQEHKPKNELAYMVQVYLHPKWINKAAVVQDMMSDKLKIK